MNSWLIVYIICGIINAMVFCLALYDFIMTWHREGKKEWFEVLAGIFFVPLAALFVILWPFRKLNDFFEKRRTEELIKKRDAFREKCHILSFGLRLKNLPFTPSTNDLIYIENEYNERINTAIVSHQDFIQDCLNKGKTVQLQFVYLPSVYEKVVHNRKMLDYMVPYTHGVIEANSKKLSSSMLLDFMSHPENRKNITPCFARYLGEDKGELLFECIGFEINETVDEKELFRALCDAFDSFPRPVGPAYQKSGISVHHYKKLNDVDEDFEKASIALMNEIAEKISELRLMGVSQWALEQLVKPQFKLSCLKITKDNRLILPDYQNMEIKMEPLAKAVYFLFLNHPEGVLFKELPNYRDELTEIYLKLKPNGLTERARKSIEDVTNPLLNSINEKCARIRGAFVEQFDNSLARNYYIDGQRAKPKKISLSRKLVVWE